MIGQHYYTWCPGGAGIAGYPGFQTRAQSPSVKEHVRQRVLSYCERYELPRSLNDLKSKVEDLTLKDLASCPVGIHFYQIVPGLCGLTRMRLAARQRGRPNNYFAHTYLFPWEALRGFDSNPFAVVRAGLFRDDAEGDTQELPDLTAFPSPPSDAERTPAFPESVRIETVVQLLACLTVEESCARPVIICTSDWSESAALIEAALLLLPPAARAGVSFSTYEHDPYRLLLRSGDKDNPWRTIIATIPPEEGGRFQFSQDELKSRFYVLDLCHGKSSEVPALSTYVSYAGDAVARAAIPEVRRLHWLIESLGLSAESESWSTLIPAILLAPFNNERGLALTDGRELRPAIQALQSACKTPARAALALRLLWNRCCEVVSETTPEAAGLVLGAGIRMLERCDEPETFRRDVAPDLSRRLAGFVTAGSYVLARDLLAIGGQAHSDTRRRVLHDGWSEALQTDWPDSLSAMPRTGEEKDAFVGLFAEWILEVGGDLSADVLSTVIKDGFQLSEGCKCLSQFWKAVGDWLVSNGLSRLPLAEAGPLAVSLWNVFDRERIRDGQWQLLLWRLEHPGMHEDRDELFRQMTVVCRNREDPPKAASALLECAQKALSPPASWNCPGESANCDSRGRVASG